jgi:hypothetical protein
LVGRAENIPARTTHGYTPKKKKMFKTFYFHDVSTDEAIITKQNTSGAELISAEEKWHLTQYYSALYQLDPVKFKDHLSIARQLIAPNPHPNIYRTVLMNLFKQTSSSSSSSGSQRNDSVEVTTRKIGYLLETQSTALRHKACQIHLRHRRKGTIEPKLFEHFIKSIAFKIQLDGDSSYLQNFVKNLLPEDLCVLALVLVPDEMDLYLIRLEKNAPPLLTKFKYDQRFTDEFKQIMAENDKSMKQSDRNIFWTTRNFLNKKLSNFVNELEESVFANKKALLLGSYVDFDVEVMLDEFKKEFRLVSGAAAGASVSSAASRMNSESDQLLRNILLGVEFYSVDDLKGILRSVFGSKVSERSVEAYLAYFVNVIKPKVTGAKRKHVCLLNDKV